MKLMVRLVVALFGAVFGALLLSVQACSYAARQADRPRWADFICGHNVGYQWIVSLPLLFVLLLTLLSTPLSRFRRTLVVMVLAVYGFYGVIQSFSSPLAWTALFPPAVLAAAVGVALRARWARYLVYALTGVFVITWGYSIWVAANAGYFESSGPGRSLLSLMPGVAFVLLGLFCCYVVTDGRPFDKTRPVAGND